MHMRRSKNTTSAVMSFLNARVYSIKSLITTIKTKLYDMIVTFWIEFVAPLIVVLVT